MDHFFVGGRRRNVAVVKMVEYYVCVCGCTRSHRLPRRLSVQLMTRWTAYESPLPHEQ